MERIIILGGGYGGMRTLQHLLPEAEANHCEFLLIDQEPYHCMKTEYYALAAGTISDKAVRVPFPDHPALTIIQREVSDINLKEKNVKTSDGQTHAYDSLIIGLGSDDKYHSVPGAREHTLGIQSIDDVRETATTLHNIPRGGTVCIVGGGLSGIEVASELSESRSQLNIRLYDRGDRILSGFPEKVSHYIQDWFADHGVEVINHANITKVEPGVLYNNDEPVNTDVVVWTAGVQPNQIVRDLDVEDDGSGRVNTTEHHFISDYPEVFVIGDCAASDHAPSAQLAEAHGDRIADVIKSRWKNEPLPELSEIKLKGVLGSLGHKKGFGMMGNTALTGRVPRMLKSGVLWLYKYHNG